MHLLWVLTTKAHTSVPPVSSCYLLFGPDSGWCAKNFDGSLALNQSKEIQLIAKDSARNPMTIDQFLRTPEEQIFLVPRVVVRVLLARNVDARMQGEVDKTN